MLLDLKERYHAYFYGGRFLSVTPDLTLPARVYACGYTDGKGRIVALCNNAGKQIALAVYGRPVTLADGEVTVLELED